MSPCITVKNGLQGIQYDQSVPVQLTFVARLYNAITWSLTIAKFINPIHSVWKRQKPDIMLSGCRAHPLDT